MKYKAVLFDLDGTLLDTLGDLTYAVNLTLDDYSFPHRTKEEVRSFIGNGVRKLIERSLPRRFDGEFLDKVTSEYKLHYAENMMRETAPYDGIPELLESLRAEGRLLGVVSNKFDASTKHLCEVFFPQLHISQGENESQGILRKPNPAMVLHVMEALGVVPSETLYVGDSETDLMTAANAGIDCISVTWGFRSKELLTENGARHFASSAEEFSEVLRRLESDR